MVNLEEIYLGQELYYMYFAPNRKAQHYFSRPAKVISLNPTYRFPVELEENETGIIIDSELKDLYKTEKEAREAWRSGIYNRIDYLRSRFEKEIRELKIMLNYDN